MKKTLCLYLAFLAMLTSFAAKVPSGKDQKNTLTTTEASSITATADEAQQSLSAKAFNQLSVSDLQKALGRKLTLKEKISLWLYKKKLMAIEPSEREKKNANTNAILGLVFGILGLIVFQFFAIPGLILSNKALRAERADPGILAPGNKGIAVAGQITSYVGLALLILVTIIIIAFISNWH